MHQSVHIPHSATGMQPCLHTHIQSTQLTAAHLVRMAASSTEFTAERAPRSMSSLLGTLEAARSVVLLAEASVSRRAPCTCHGCLLTRAIQLGDIIQCAVKLQ
jgi:hypothetical protein